jgi:hypothetical protein
MFKPFVVDTNSDALANTEFLNLPEVIQTVTPSLDHAQDCPNLEIFAYLEISLGYVPALVQYQSQTKQKLILTPLVSVHGVTGYISGNPFTDLQTILQNGFIGHGINAFMLLPETDISLPLEIATESILDVTQGDKYLLVFHRYQLSKLSKSNTSLFYLTLPNHEFVKSAFPQDISILISLNVNSTSVPLEEKKKFYKEHLERFSFIN